MVFRVDVKSILKYVSRITTQDIQPLHIDLIKEARNQGSGLHFYYKVYSYFFIKG